MFAISGRGLPRVRSYAEAVKVHEEAHQHERFPGSWRGLKDKRDTTKKVRMSGDAVYFRFHDTDLVVWYPDKVVFKLYDSQSSVIFTNRFVPPGMWATTVKGEMYLQYDGKHYSQREADGIVFILDPDTQGRWFVDEDSVHHFQREVLDRKRAHQVRKVMSPFLDWWQSMERLGAPVHCDRTLHTYDVLESLRVSLARGVIPEEHYRQLAASSAIRSGDLLKEAYVLGGAVRKEPAPAGTPRPVYKYDGLKSWQFV